MTRPDLPHRSRAQRPRQRRSVIVLLLLLLFWSVCLGWGLALATEPRSFGTAAGVTEPLAANPLEPVAAGETVGTIDIVPQRLQAGKRLYLETCATCHVGLPPEIMPSETWRQLLPDPQHYGVDLQPLRNPNLRVVWEYLRTFSRPQSVDEQIPYRVYQSRYFKALHPDVKLPVKAGVGSCISCHPGAGSYDFRRLSAEWQNAP